MEITSINNDRIKYYTKLQQKKYRYLYKEFLVEGEHVVEEAIKKGIVKEIILISDIDYDGEKIFVTKEIMRKISALDNPTNAIAVCKMTDSEIKGNRFLLLDNIQDPGNLGTIIRSALAFNIDTLILSEDTVDLYNSKVIRATQGMFLHLNIVKRDLKDVIINLKNKNIKIYGTKVDGGKDLKEINNLDNYAIILGNEGEGIRKEILDMCDEFIYIKTNNLVESLNVGVAAGIILYHFNN